MVAVLVALMNFLLSNRLVTDQRTTTAADKPNSASTKSPPRRKSNKDIPIPSVPPPKKTLKHLKPSDLKLPTPIFVVGMPKVGTSSIHEMFRCHSIKSSHYCCCGSNRTHTHCNDGKLFSVCMMENKKANKPILQDCGDYDVYAQMDAEHRKGMFLPQHFELERLHEFAPSATFILNMRPAADWISSVENWFGLGARFLQTYGYPRHKHREIDRHQVLTEIYKNHSQYIREFVKTHPSHALVEVNITDSSAGNVLAEAFGLSEECWGQHNKNWRKEPIGSTLKNPLKN